MKAYILDRYAKKAALRFGERPDPALRDNDVLIEVYAAGLNLLDSKIRDGEFKPILPYRPPLILGHDVAGMVVRVGPKARRFKVGDAVYARPRDGRIGTFAEFIAVEEADVALKPVNLSMEEAASLPLVGLTAWQVLVDRARLSRGQKVLIHAGSGGVGTFAIQLAKQLGAKVATTASAANADLVRSLGADVVIDYKTEDFAQARPGAMAPTPKPARRSSKAMPRPAGTSSTPPTSISSASRRRFWVRFWKGSARISSWPASSRGATHPTPTAWSPASRKAMIASVEASLRRLKTDRIDLYWAHWPDDVTGSEEIVRGFEDLACAGKIIYAGLSHPNSASALIRSPSPGLDRTAPSP